MGTQTFNMGTQATIAGLGATAALAVIALNYQAPEGTQLFHNEVMTAADYEFIKYVAKAVGKVAGFKDVVKDSTGANLKAALATGPVSVAIEADQSVFQTYTSGVITSSKCGTQLDHGVLAVGYGTEDGNDYFLVKNSWGASWGDNGYVKIGAANVCGINAQPSFPTE